MWQIVEKEDYGTDWHQVQFDDNAIKRFDSEKDAMDAAKKYMTEINCNNALTKDEKKKAFECFMVTDNGIYLGQLDNEAWFLTDGRNRAIKNKTYFELDGKTEVSVRKIPGS